MLGAGNCFRDQVLDLCTRASRGESPQVHAPHPTPLAPAKRAYAAITEAPPRATAPIVDTEAEREFSMHDMVTRAAPVNPKLLEQIASMTVGTPYLATDTLALKERFQKILEDLEKSRIHDRGVLYAELYRRFVLVALALLVAELALRLTRFRRLP